ncbi:MAG: hypothetical protein R3293_16155 [Candidatus Promineifilaceae bacterium]|nr:hypothetical protein [Candidatus Promineifilaceae bacterium]
MSFNWLNNFQQNMEKPADYAEKTLAAYAMGMKAKGSIAGVRIIPDGEGCAASRKLDPQTTYHPDKAPRLPLPECERGARCRCIYRPVMTYQLDEEE